MSKPSECPESIPVSNRRMPFFKRGQIVLAQDIKNRVWVKAGIIRPIGRCLFEIDVDGRRWKRHANQLRMYNGSPQSIVNFKPSSILRQPLSKERESVEFWPQSLTEGTGKNPTVGKDVVQVPNAPNSPTDRPLVLRRSTRVRFAPDHLSY